MNTVPIFQHHFVFQHRFVFHPASHCEMFSILAHKTYNHERRLITFFWGETIDADKFSTLHTTAVVEAIISLSSRIQKLNLCQVETVVLSCIAVFFPGTYFLFLFLLFPLLCGIDVRWQTPPCCTVEHYIRPPPRQPLLFDITRHSVQPSSLTPSYLPSPLLAGILTGKAVFFNVAGYLSHRGEAQMAYH